MLFDPLDKPGFISLRNRTVMSAMSRGFASEGHHATEQMRDYYVRRAAAGVGLILTEGTFIDQSGDGWNSAPHIASDAHVQSWAPLVAAVQAEGARIACQLWHAGRISHEDYTIVQPVSSTNRAAEGINRQNNKPYGVPRALETDEMPSIYRLYVDAARRSLDAGFDAIELHLGHGYLADQFLDARVNDRTEGCLLVLRVQQRDLICVAVLRPTSKRQDRALTPAALAVISDHVCPSSELVLK